MADGMFLEDALRGSNKYLGSILLLKEVVLDCYKVGGGIDNLNIIFIFHDSINYLRYILSKHFLG